MVTASLSHVVCTHTNNTTAARIMLQHMFAGVGRVRHAKYLQKPFDCIAHAAAITNGAREENTLAK